MPAFSELWADEHGFVLSTEAVLLGTVATIGVTAALAAFFSSATEELRGHAGSLRGFDQSFEIPAQHSGRTYVAGSQFQQSPVNNVQTAPRSQVHEVGQSHTSGNHESADIPVSAFPDRTIDEARRRKQPQRRAPNSGR